MKRPPPLWILILLTPHDEGVLYLRARLVGLWPFWVSVCGTILHGSWGNSSVPGRHEHLFEYLATEEFICFPCLFSVNRY